jgi:hypothetical protein
MRHLTVHFAPLCRLWVATSSTGRYASIGNWRDVIRFTRDTWSDTIITVDPA